MYLKENYYKKNKMIDDTSLKTSILSRLTDDNIRYVKTIIELKITIKQLEEHIKVLESRKYQQWRKN